MLRLEKINYNHMPALLSKIGQNTTGPQTIVMIQDLKYDTDKLEKGYTKLICNYIQNQRWKGLTKWKQLFIYGSSILS